MDLFLGEKSLALKNLLILFEKNGLKKRAYLGKYCFCKKWIISFKKLGKGF